MNRWFDFVEGKGGNMVDFGVQFFGVPVSDFLKRLQEPGVSISHQSKTLVKQGSECQDNKPINILSVQDISAYPLLRYVQSRRIGNDIAQKYLKEVHYQVGDKNYYALGFKNDAGGYELRNEHFQLVYDL